MFKDDSALIAFHRRRMRTLSPNAAARDSGCSRRFSFCAVWAILTSMVFVVVVGGAPVSAKDIFVNNLGGNDRQDGRTEKPQKWQRPGADDSARAGPD